MKTVKTGDLIIGSGMPKICVPVIEKDMEGIFSEAERICGLPADLVEWRADWYSELSDLTKVLKVLEGLKRILDVPVLFTVRTAAEGGKAVIGGDEYGRINRAAAGSGLADLIDVEVLRNDAGLVGGIQGCGVPVIASSHDFHKTPDRQAIIRLLYSMLEYGADIVKLAVMPLGTGDVMELMSAVEEVNRGGFPCPIIAMSMSGTGAISRMAGEVFGSAVTFGSAGSASAPGQIEVGKLKEILMLIHTTKAGGENRQEQEDR